jgi:hypothetical protein
MNELSVNMVILSVENGHLLRVLWISPERNEVYVFDLETQAMPEAISYATLQGQICDGIYVVQDTDPFLRIVSEEALNEKDKQIREKAWQIMEHAVHAEPQIYVRRERARIASQLMSEANIKMAVVHRYLKAYWQRGKTKNAFLPLYKNCGASGKERSSGEQKRGRPRKYGDGVGVNVDDKMKTTFESVIAKYYHTRNENTLQYTYERMIAEYFSEIVSQPDGTVKREVFPDERRPTITQFRYWYNKKHGVTEKLTKRKGETKFALKHRAIIGKSDFGVMGPCAKYQIDATIGDVYLVSRFNRADIIGRPIIYFVIDVFSRMVAGMYVGLEGPSRNGSMMAIANACSDKVKYCAEYGIEIADEEWPCHHIPNSILADRGEMESMSVDTIVNALNVRVENARAYRGDMKGIIEQYFNRINSDALTHLPGHVSPGAKERGGVDYRVQAILDIRQLTEVLIQCVLYHNNRHLHKTFELTTDMIADDMPPIPLQVWNWGITHCSGALRTYPEEAVKLALMPIDTASVTAKGIRFKGMYYLCDRAISEHWLEEARAKGSFKVDISYDSRNMNRIYIRNSDGSVDVCTLTEWQEKYTDKCLDEILKLHESKKNSERKHEPQELTSKADLLAGIDRVIAEAEDMARQTSVPKSKAERTKNIRENRSNEKESNRHDEAFTIVENDESENASRIAENDESENIPSLLAMLKQQLEERRNDK